MGAVRPECAKSARGRRKPALFGEKPARHVLILCIAKLRDQFDNPIDTKTLLISASLGQPISVWGSGKAERDFLFSGDAAYALRLIAENHTGAINLATGQSHTIRHTVDTLCRISGFSGSVEWDATKPDGQKLRAYDISRLTALGFKPRFSFDEALAITYDWYCKNVASARK
ncbi:NAD-dependent epimerase/dehydratase family protein [Burkholderia multivorans]|uniref:NAD-dependent epimerase/dehydratase family protein n=1 Tax=Burkholderia multivorans TaxID=87883 RepID=UPI00201996F5|nr:NAD-dependent epimerase/dehydratase family protein [Burkholderia multivorans]UQO78172.1 NAD-dependent epimerase/dehydratase family protein [Burkholderia multivorans]